MVKNIIILMTLLMGFSATACPENLNAPTELTQNYFSGKNISTQQESFEMNSKLNELNKAKMVFAKKLSKSYICNVEVTVTVTYGNHSYHATVIVPCGDEDEAGEELKEKLVNLALKMGPV